MKKDQNYWKNLYQFKKNAESIQKRWGLPINKYRTFASRAFMTYPKALNS
tara:strand:- start:107 stop:256 length:150 start_codon:yes stop_codon:yes gene_type:complete